MSKYKGNIVSSAATVSSGTNYTGKANGKWSLQEQIQAIFSNLWAKGIKPPDAPVLTAVGKSTTLLKAYFEAPANLNGETIIDYTATAGSFSATGSSSPITITGLTTGTSYSVTVKANSASGSSAASNAISQIPATITAPSAPVIINAVYLSSTSAKVYFTPSTSDGGDPNIFYTAVESVNGSVSSPSLTSPVTITGLAPEFTYTFAVKAANSAGASAYSGQSNSVFTKYLTRVLLKGDSLLTNTAVGVSAPALSTRGSPSISTTISKIDGSSISLNGTSGLYCSPSVGLSGDFTIEGWLYRTVRPSAFMIFAASSDTWFGYYPDADSIYMNPSKSWGFGTIPENTWHHIAITRQSGIVRCFMNGVKSSTEYTVSSQVTVDYIGCFTNTSYGVQGYIDEFRITDGIARYTSNFTPNTTGFTLD
jgi:hypothetical protein